MNSMEMFNDLPCVAGLPIKALPVVTTIGGIPVCVDPDLPPNEARLQSQDGLVSVRIVNIGREEQKP